MFSTDDTIVAVATGGGRASLGVIRISGREALTVASRLLGRNGLEPRKATLARVRDLTAGPTRQEPQPPTGEASGPTIGDDESSLAAEPRALDQVVATYFPQPASYTAEDVVEISAHGSPVLLERIVVSAMHAGARLARPGEFTFRAYLHGKLDLIQAEAVADLIDAVTPAQAHQAFDQLDGTLTRRIATIRERVFDLIVQLEASLDFPDEGYRFIEPEQAIAALDGMLADTAALLSTARAGRVLREGRRVAIAGRTNVGKSSLFNALLGADRAIVTLVPGTTRDLLAERCDMGGIPITLVDTAGLRPTDEPVEQEGQARAREAADSAALVLVVLDASQPLDQADHEMITSVAARRAPMLLVANKSDLPNRWNGTTLIDPDLRSAMVVVSAKTGAGLSDLRHAVTRVLTGADDLRDSVGVSNARHIDLLERFDAILRRVRRDASSRAPEEILLADLQQADALLGEIAGRRMSTDVLDAIFSRFCIGK